MRRLAALLLSLFLVQPAAAETLVTAVSAETISISSNFSGTEIVVFGTIERDAATVARNAPYQVVVVVEGPTIDLVTREKERTLGLWINRGAEEMAGVPSFYAIASTPPIEEVADEPMRARLGLGLAMLPIGREATAEPPVRTVYEEAFLRLMQERGLYRQEAGTVEFLSPSLFRAHIRLPATVPIGDYTATAYLFTGPILLTSMEGAITVQKIGFEAFVTEYSREHTLIYGLAAVLAASGLGWIAGVLFRRD